MGFDTDGTEWKTVRYVVDVQVMADNDEDAIYYANLALPDYDLSNYEGKVID